jgi:PAS domain S-box-containing protein
MPSFRSLLSFSAFIDEVPDGLLLVDATGTIRDVNERTVELFKYDVAELLGAPIEQLVPDRHETEHVGLREEYLSAPERRPMGTDLILLGERRDGTTFPVQVSLAPITEGEDTYILASVRDVTERVQFQQQASVLNRILRHNIRNRLNVIQGNVDLLAEEVAAIRADLEALDDEDLTWPVPETPQVEKPPLRQFFEDWQSFPDQAAAILATVQESSDQLLDLAERARQLEETEPSAHGTEPHDVAATVREAVAVVDSEGLTVEANDVESRVFGFDRDALSIVLHELLSNAVEHGATDQLWIRGQVEEDHYVLEVEDDGAGIPDVELETIQSLQEGQLQHGLGLGLWVSKWFVSRMDGDLDFETTDTGTVVSVRLPLES